MSDYFSHDIKLQPGTRARAEDVNDRFDGVVQGFDKLPTPHGTMKGFAEPVAVGDATGLAHAAPVGQVVDGRLFYAQDTGTVNSHIVDLVIAPAAYAVGMQVAFKALHGNTGAATLNLNGLGQKQLVRANGSQLSSGDYLAGAIITAVYDGSKFVVTSYLPGQATETKAQRDTAVQAAADAISAKNAAVIAKNESEAAQAGSQAARAAAEAANVDAQSAKEAAEAAQAGAETARTGAETARTGAQTARTGAESAKVAAETARADTLAIYGSTTAMQNAVMIAQDSASTATSAKNLAAEWAVKDEDLAVTGFPGKYSAKHHAIKASAFKSGAEAAKVGADTAKTAAQTAKSAAETARDGAETAKVASEAARDKSQKWADEQKDTPVEPGKYSAKHWAEKAAEMVFAGGLETVNVTPPLTVDKSDINAPEIGFSGTKADVGLDNVDNTSDQDKPISAATQAALNGKANTAHRHDEVYELKNANIQEHISSTGNTHNLTLAQLGAAAATHGHTSLLNLVATGSLTDDPNNFTEGLRLTNHSNGPLGTNSEYFYILTFFYNTQGSAANRSQLAIGYRGSKLYTRNWFSADGWSAWVSCHNSAVLGEIQPALATKADKAETEAAIIALEDVPFAYQRGVTLPSIKGYSVAADRAVLVWPRVRVVDHNTGIAHVIPAIELNINSPLAWDDGQYATAANRAGRNFCLYLLSDGTLLLSANSIAPIGHTTVNSLKIGGFHCMCVSVGTISGHRLTGFVAGDILPDSVWDLMHRPSCAPSGMVYSQEADIWVDIYLQSGTGANTASVYGATITATRNWMDFVDDLAAVGKRLLSDPEFQVIASGSNEKTSIAGSADPITTGGHIDTAGRRMISNIGCEDCCGALWQWTGEQSYATNSATFTFSWFELPGGKGSIYKQGGTFGDVKLLAGGAWNNGTYCGSRSRNASGYRWYAGAGLGARGCARSHT